MKTVSITTICLAGIFCLMISAKPFPRRHNNKTGWVNLF